MSNFQRILNMASKALDKNGQGSSTGSGKGDWRDVVRTVADKVTGDSTTQNPDASRRAAAPTNSGVASPAVAPEDRAAIARYEYLLKTAHPEQLEQVHRDAFARLTPAQRQQVEAQLREELPVGDQPASSSADDLARSATRGEATHPGFLSKLFSRSTGRGAAMAGAGAVAGVGIGAAGGLLAAVAGGAVLSSVAAPLLEQAAGMGVDFESFATDFGGLSEGAGEYASGLGEQASEYTSGLGEQASEFGSNFEIPGLGNLGDLFGRNN
ncbi:MAG TPA: hypothetical protein VGP24_16410 [Glaciihabitans sp.]|nr:hypothetical protein [Glaciihabitans sp.]